MSPEGLSPPPHLLPVRPQPPRLQWGRTQNVINQFSRIASDPRTAFVGNVTVGRDVSVQELRQLYDVVSEGNTGVHCVGDFPSKRLPAQGTPSPKS